MKVVAHDARGERVPDRPAPKVDFAEATPVVVCDGHPTRFVATALAAIAGGALPLLLPAGTPRSRAMHLAATLGASAVLYADEAAEVEVTRTPGRALDFDEAGYLACTSGSTGDEPTVYLFSMTRARANARAHLRSLGLERARGTKLLVPLPLAHSFGFVAGVLAAEELDAELHTTTQLPTPSVLFELIAREKIEVFHTTPTHLRSLTRVRVAANGAAVDSLRVACVGSSSVSARDARELARHFPGARRFATYGLTECGPRVATLALEAIPSALPDDTPVPLGQPIDGVALDVVDIDSNDVGELVVSTAHLAKARVASGSVVPLDESVPFHTADRVLVLGDSRTVLGRADGVIVRGGTNVYPRTIECVAERLPGVHAACAVPRVSAMYGAVPVLVVEPDPDVDERVLMASLEAACTSELTMLERPVAIVLAVLPRTALGKIRRGEVAARHGGVHA